MVDLHVYVLVRAFFFYIYLYANVQISVNRARRTLPLIGSNEIEVPKLKFVRICKVFAKDKMWIGAILLLKMGCIRRCELFDRSGIFFFF